MVSVPGSGKTCSGRPGAGSYRWGLRNSLQERSPAFTSRNFQLGGVGCTGMLHGHNEIPPDATGNLTVVRRRLRMWGG